MSEFGEFAFVDGRRHVVRDGLLVPLTCCVCGADALPTRLGCLWGPRGTEPICAEDFANARKLRWNSDASKWERVQ